MRYPNRISLLFMIVTLFGATSCNPNRPTAAGAVAANATANPVLIATAQADQYGRDAQATTQARAAQAAAATATYEADWRNVQATAAASGITATALQIQATATAAIRQ